MSDSFIHVMSDSGVCGGVVVTRNLPHKFGKLLKFGPKSQSDKDETENAQSSVTKVPDGRVV